MDKESIVITLNKEQIELIVDSIECYCYTVSSVLSYDEAVELNSIKFSILDMIQKNI